MKTIFPLLLLLTIQFAIAQRKITSRPGYYFANQLAKIVDKTFEYPLLDKDSLYSPLVKTLPDSLGGKKIDGTVEFYSYINDSGEIEKIEITQIDLYRNHVSYLRFPTIGEPSTKGNRYFKRFKLYFNNLVSTLKFTRGENATQSKLHKTFGVVRF